MLRPHVCVYLLFDARTSRRYGFSVCILSTNSVKGSVRLLVKLFSLDGEK